MEEQAPRLVMYGIGIQYTPKEFGMIAGPTLNEKELLDGLGGENTWIIRFNADWTETLLWRWIDDEWVSVTAENTRE